MFRRIARRVLNKLGGSESDATSRNTVGDAPPPPPPLEATSVATIEAGAQEIKERLDAGEPVVLLDVRQPEETAAGIIAGARHIPLPELRSRWEELADCNEIVCYCARGGRSLQAAQLLREKGLFNATSLEGGVAQWAAIGGNLVPQ